MQQEKQPRPQDYGYEEPHIEVEGGWCIEGGQEAYEDAMERWNAAQASKQPSKPKPTDYGYDPINGWPDAETMERYVVDLQNWFDSPNEGDFEQMERTQEQAARLRDEAEQNADAEEPFMEPWQKLMRQHSKTELIAALKSALCREQSHKEARQSAYKEIDQLREKIAKQTRVIEWAKAISLSLSQNPSLTPEEAAVFLKVHHGIINDSL